MSHRMAVEGIGGMSHRMAVEGIGGMSHKMAVEGIGGMSAAPEVYLRQGMHFNMRCDASVPLTPRVDALE